VAPLRLPGTVALALAIVGGGAGCEHPPLARHEAGAQLPTAPAARNREEALRRARFELAVLARELERERPAASTRSAERCPDPLLRAAGGDPTVFVRVSDRRADQRQLVPLSVRRAIGRDELEPLRDELDGRREDGARGRSGALSTAEIERARGRIARLRARPYVAEFELSAYAEPRITRRAGSLRSEWVPGILAARLTVYDRRDGAVRCQTPLLVRSRVADAPVSLRLRPATRERLIDELGTELHAAGARALPAMSDHLRWPAGTSAADRGELAGAASSPPLAAPPQAALAAGSAKLR